MTIGVVVRVVDVGKRRELTRVEYRHLVGRITFTPAKDDHNISTVCFRAAFLNIKINK